MSKAKELLESFKQVDPKDLLKAKEQRVKELPKRLKWTLKSVLGGFRDNVPNIYGIGDSREALDILSNMMSSEAWGKFVKEEFFYGDEGFREHLESALVRMLKGLNPAFTILDPEVLL